MSYSGNAPFNGPLFIGGMPRSGTKLLRNLLNRHPRISILEIETEFLPWLARCLGEYGDLSNVDNFHRFYGTIVRLPYFIYRANEGRLIDVDNWHKACTNYGAANIFEILVRLEIGAPPHTNIIWGDKSPSYIDDLPLIADLYPQARFIHIVRDVRDYCLSIQKAWGKYMLRAAKRWVDGVTAASQSGSRLGDRYLEVRYEDLLLDTEDIMRVISEYLGIDYDPAMTTLDKPSENLGNAKGQSSVLKSNSRKYLTIMPNKTLRRIEKLAGQVLLEKGYELNHPIQPAARLSKAEMLYRQFKDGVGLVKYETRQQGLLGALRFHFRYFQTTRG